MEPKIIEGDNVFTDNTLLRLNSRKYRLRFIKVGQSRYTIELHGLDPISLEVIGEWNHGKYNDNGDLTFATIIEE